MKAKHAEIKVKLICDSSAVTKALSKLKLYFPRLPRNIRSHIRKIFLDIDKVPSKISKLISVESAPAPGKGTTTIVSFKPTQFFLDLLAACGTGNFDNLFVKRNSHKKPSKKG